MTATEARHDPREVDEARLAEFVGRFVGDLGAVLHAATVLVGDRLGLYRAMADGSWVDAGELATRTGTDRRYVAEWLAAQAASGYVEADPPGSRFRLPAEQSLALTDEDNPLFAPGGLQVAASSVKDVDLVVEAFRTGRGVDWGAHDPDLFDGTERFFRPNYIAHLVSEWIPALDGVAERLEAGGAVADVGCGHGASTLLMAGAFPRSRCTGFDPHPPSIEAARRRADAAGPTGRPAFAVATAKDYPGRGYDLVTCFDCLHDMGDPVGAAAHVRESLAEDGVWMIVEPYAGDRLADNLTPVGRVFYSASTMICTPGSRSQEIGAALGAQAGEARLREVLTAGGFGRVRRAAQTPFNLVLEARP
ncbi:class I SAM-dependent methyltransferase [Pseudonocardia sp. RS010]|uniref:class I SAM-dependent methyltransferase n=1 Tax=Pseudonocardia sp. RS010 TaxID=3385979 RepID=UPI00399F4EEB